MMHTPAAVNAFAALGFALLVAHNVADHWAQTDCQAAYKGAHGWTGRLACLRHVATHTGVCAAAVAAVAFVFGLTITPAAAVVGVAVHAGTHYFADRRVPLRRLAEAVGLRRMVLLGVPRQALGHEDHDDNPSLGTGMYALDQSWHWLWIGVTAAILATP